MSAGLPGLGRDVTRHTAAIATLGGLLLAAVASLGSGPAISAPPRSPIEVQAAFLYRFLFYVRDAPSAAPDGELCLGLLGPDPFDGKLEEIDGTMVRGRTVHVRGFERPQQIDTCEVVFISPEFEGGAETAARELQQRGVLTVSTAGGFARRGGIIELTYHRERVRFDVNRATAVEHGVHLNAELLEVARRVYQ